MDTEHDTTNVDRTTSSSTDGSDPIPATEAPIVGVALLRVTIRDTQGLGKAERPTVKQLADDVEVALGETYDFGFAAEGEWVSE